MTEPSTDHLREAYRILTSREHGRVRLDDSALRAVPAGQRAAVFDLVQGSRRNVFLLDAVLRRFLKKPLRQLPPNVRDALRLGIYELMFRSRAPVGGVVSRVVDLVGRHRALRGLVNAVLRKAADSMEHVVVDDAAVVHDRGMVRVAPGRSVRFSSPVLPDPAQDLVGWHSLHYTLPRPFVEQFMELLPDEHEALFRALDAPLPVTLRPTRRAGSMDGLLDRLRSDGVALGEIRGGVVEIQPGGAVGDLDVLREGLAMVQDRTAAEVAPFVAPRPGERVLDLCAGPGGKTVHLAELMHDEGEVLATDKDPDRLELVRQNADRTGLACVLTQLVSSDLDDLPEGPFQRILIDAPCSNSGVLMRRVEARFRLDAKDLGRLQEIQLALLEAAGPLLDLDGVLVYATCSILPAENELLVRRFLERHPRLKLDEERLLYPHRTLRDGGYMARILPGPVP